MVGLLGRAAYTGQQEVLLGLLSCSRLSHIGLDTADAVAVMEAGLGDAPVGHLVVRLCAQTQDTKMAHGSFHVVRLSCHQAQTLPCGQDARSPHGHFLKRCSV